jgi:hypothetical protein
VAAAEIDWGSLTLAGAFIGGALIATVAVLRLVKVIFEMDHKHRGPPSKDEPPST